MIYSFNVAILINVCGYLDTNFSPDVDVSAGTDAETSDVLICISEVEGISPVLPLWNETPFVPSC